MIIPVRCFSCGKVGHDPYRWACYPSLTNLYSKQVVGDLWERYLQLLDEGIPDG